MAKSKKHDDLASSGLLEGEFLHENPSDAALELDAILYFIHKNYPESGANSAPNLKSFLITKSEVIFSPKAKHVFLQKQPKKRALQIISPMPDPKNEEERRIYLLNQFGEQLLKCQKQAYLLIREMSRPAKS